MVYKDAGINVIALSVDNAEDTQALADGLRLGSAVQMLHSIDAHAVAAATGALIQEGDRTFLHATGFVLDPEGNVANAVYSSGPIGRLTASDVLKKVVFEKAMRAKNSAG